MSQMFVFILIALIASTDSKVIEVNTADQFNDLVKSDYSLVTFYGPQCEHCQMIMPDFIKAEEELTKNNAYPIKMAKIDCSNTDVKEICQKYEIELFPTLKYFHKSSEKPLNFYGMLTNAGIVNYAKNAVQDVILKIASQRHLDELVKENQLVIVQHAQNANSDVFSQAANVLRFAYSFATIKDSDLAKFHGIAPDGISIFRGFDEPKVHFEGEKKNLLEWIDHYSFPLIGEMQRDIFPKYLNKGLPILWFAVDKKDGKIFQKVMEFSSFLKKYKEKLLAVYIDTNEYKEVLKKMSFGENYPSVIITEELGTYKFDGAFESEQLEKFVEAFFAKSLSKFYRSEAPPEKNDGPIFEVVGDTFSEFAMDEEADVLLEHYIPLCKKCEESGLELKKLSLLYKDEKRFKIGRIESENNRTPLDVREFPTLVLYRAKKKDEPLIYGGVPKAEDIEKWLSEHIPSLTKRPNAKEEL